MDNSHIDSLKEALNYSPENIPLRFLLADNLYTLNRFDEAEQQYVIILQSGSHMRASLGLAKTYYAKGSYSACNVILEELIETGRQDFETLILHTRALVKENAIGKAISVYQTILQLNPAFTDDELDNLLRPRAAYPVSHGDGEEIENSRFLEKPSVTFNNVGGMEAVKKEISLKIIKPLEHAGLYKAYGKKTGGGILLYGPPGCGKTFIAKATAGQINSKFLSMGLNDILDMWVGNSEKNLHGIFELARRNNPCVLFIDEIDALGASRSDMKQSAGRHLINQFLQELDGIEGNNDGILVLGATNTPWNLDPAFRRPGRFDRIIFIPPPDQESRQAILHLKLQNKPAEDIDVSLVAKKMEHYSGADIDAVIDIAIEGKLEAAFIDGIPKPLTTKDLLEAVKKHKPSTQEWFATAKNFALFANNTGLYDDILTYLKIKK